MSDQSDLVSHLIILPSGKTFKKNNFAGYTDDELKATIAESFNIAHILRTLQLNTVYHYKIKEFIENNNLSTTHFKIVYKHTPYNGNKIRSFSSYKKTLLRQGKLVNKCAICNMNPIWNNKPLVLQLDHINGDHSNNSIENLRLLCPNCHTQTDTYTGRNSKKDTIKTGNLVIENIKKDIPKKIYEVKKLLDKNTLVENIKSKEFDCINCNNTVTRKSTTGMCSKCYNISARKVDRPSYQILIDEINKNKINPTARKYGVSNRTILKWVKFYEINGDDTDDNETIESSISEQKLKCKSCSKNIRKQSKTGMCQTCQKTSIRIVERPSYDILLNEVKELGYVQVGKKYGVSDNSIRKWLKNYENKL